MNLIARLFGLGSATAFAAARFAQNDGVGGSATALRYAQNDKVGLRSAQNSGVVHGVSRLSSCASYLSSCASTLSSCAKSQDLPNTSLRLLAAASLLSLPLLAHALTPMNESQLATVTGQEGVALSFDYGLNAFKADTTINGVTYKRGDALTPHLLDPVTFDAKMNIGGAVVSSGTRLNGCQRMATGPNLCSMAIATNNRAGMWVILKDMYATLKMHKFWIDGGKVSKNGSGEYILTLPGSKTFTQPFTLSNANADETRFYDAQGNCLLAGKSNGGCDMSGLPLLVMQYDPLNAKNNKADVTWHLYIGRITMQGNTGSGATTTPAYMVDNKGSFMSYQVSDFNQNEAKIHYGGRVLLFGF